MTDRLLADLALARGPLRRDDDWRERPDWFGDALAAEAWAIDVDGEHLGVQDAGLAWRPITSADADRAALLGVGSGRAPRLAVIGATESEKVAAFASSAPTCPMRMRHWPPPPWRSRNGTPRTCAAPAACCDPGGQGGMGARL